MNSCFVMCLSVFITVVFPPPGAAQGLLGAPGAPAEIDSLPQDVVEFATRKLQLANDGLLQYCRIEPVGTFTEQVVEGGIFRFDLKIQRNPGSHLTFPSWPRRPATS